MGDSLGLGTAVDPEFQRVVSQLKEEVKEKKQIVDRLRKKVDHLERVLHKWEHLKKGIPYTEPPEFQPLNEAAQEAMKKGVVS